MIPNVIDETLRFEPTGHATARYVMHDVDYHGTTVPAGSADPAAPRGGEPRPAPVPRPRRLRHPPRGRPAPDLRLGPPLLPRREPRAARGPRRARRAAEPLPRVGRRLRQHQARADVDGARLGTNATRHPLSGSRERHRATRKEPRWRSTLRPNRSSSSPTTRTSVRAWSRTCGRTARRVTSTSSTGFAGDDGTREASCDQDARGQRVPRPPELPHRRPSRLRRTAGRLRPRRCRRRRDLPRQHEHGTDPVRRRWRSGKARRARSTSNSSGVGSRSTTAGSPTSLSQAPHRHIGLAYCPDVGRRRRGRRGRVGARGRPAGRQLPRHARR